MPDLVSRQTRRAFQESYVGYSVLREIETDFDDAAVPRGTLPEGKFVSGARRSLVEQYYASVDWSSPTAVRRVLDAYESHLLRLKERGGADEHSRLVALLARDKLPYENGVIRFSPHDETLDDLVDKSLSVDVAQLRVNIARIKNAVEDDPDLAIGSAKELVEATCKAILAQGGTVVPTSADIPELIRLTCEQLNLVAANVSDAKKGAHSIRRVLGSLGNIVQGLAELRNLYGSGHGKSPAQRSLSSRHARLCAGAAATLALFLMETAAERSGT